MKNLLLLCAALFLTAGIARAQEPETHIKTGVTVPAFKIRMFDGRMVDIENLKQKVAFWNFWAAWCPPFKWIQKGSIDQFKSGYYVFVPISYKAGNETIDFRYKFPKGTDVGSPAFKPFTTDGISRNLIGRSKTMIPESGYIPESFGKPINELTETLKNK